MFKDKKHHIRTYRITGNLHTHNSHSSPSPPPPHYSYAIIFTSIHTIKYEIVTKHKTKKNDEEANI